MDFLPGALGVPILNAQISDGLVGYYQFESDFSSEATTTGPDGTAIEGAVAGAAGGLLGNAMQLVAADGNQHMNLPLTYGDGATLGQNFTISAWYNLNETPGENGSSRYFVYEGETGFSVSYGTRDLGIGDPGINDSQIFTVGGGPLNVADGALPGWQHVIQTYELVEENVEIKTFVNGAFVGTITTPATNVADVGLNIGAARGTAANRGFDGLIDEVAVWDRTISSAEALSVYALSLNGQSLVSPDPADTPPTIASFTASPGEVERGENATLSWEVTGSTSVTLSDGFGNVMATDSQEVRVEADATYYLVAINGNAVTTEEVTVGIVVPAADLTSDLVAYYSFNNDFSNDPSVSGPDATAVNEAVAGAAGGIAGNALQLSAPINQHANSLVTFGGEESDLGDSFTISVWYRLNEMPADNGSSRYFVFESAENFPISFGLRDLGLGEPGINDGQTFSLGGNQGYEDAALEGWHQVVQRYTAANNSTEIETFIDGGSRGSISIPTANIVGTGINFGAPRSMVVNRGFDGLIDEVAMWSRPLSDEEITLTFDLGTAGAGVIGTLEEFRITSIDFDGTTATIEFVTVPGGTYAIDQSFDLINWDDPKIRSWDQVGAMRGC